MKYTIDIRDNGGDWGQDLSVDAESFKAALDWAEEYAKETIADGDYAQDEIGGARITVYLTVTDEDGEREDRSTDIDIEPDDDALIRAVGGDPDCAHEWSSEDARTAHIAA